MTTKAGQARAVRRLLLDAIRARRPLSLIRLADGESAFLGYPEFADRSQYEWFLKRWWGISGLSSTDHERLKRDVLGAARAADILGIPDPNHPTREDMRNVYKILERYSALGDQATMTSQIISIRLEELDFFKQLFSEQPEVGLITPNAGIGPILESRFGTRIHLIRVRGQTKYFSDGQHYPDEYERVLSEIRPGLPYVVGTGICGKVYCARAKELGGVAIDAGSVVDFWAGKNTRIIHGKWQKSGRVRLGQ